MIDSAEAQMIKAIVLGVLTELKAQVPTLDLPKLKSALDKA